MSFILITILMSLLCYAMYRCKRRRVHELMKNIPSLPGATSVFGALKYTPQGQHILYKLLIDYSRHALENNGIVRIITDPQLIIGLTNMEDGEYILKNCLVKDNIMDLFKEIVGNASLIASVPSWIRRRKLLMPAFSPKIIKGFINIQARRGKELADALGGRVGSVEFSILHYINAYTLGSIAETALGVQLDTFHNPNVPFLKAMSDIFYLMSTRVLKVWLWPQWTYKYSWLHAQVKQVKPILFSLPDKIIKEKRDAFHNSQDKDKRVKQIVFGIGQDTKSFLDHLIMLSEEENRLSNIELREEILVMMLAGTDSTAVAIGYTLVLLAKYPEIQERVYNEIVNHLGNTDRLLQSEDVMAFQYLTNVVKESLRLYPPVPMILRNSGDAEITLPSGPTLPSRTTIVIPIWGMNRDPKYWGSNAECFDPDRFCDKELKLLSFSVGPRNCIGIKYAMQSVKIAVASILRHYKVVGVPETGPVPTIDSTYSIMLRAIDNFKISLEKR